MLTGKEITTLWRNTGVTFGCLEGVQHQISVCVCECPDREPVSSVTFFLNDSADCKSHSSYLVGNINVLLPLWPRQTDTSHNGQKKERVTIVPKKYKGIHSCQCAHTLNHTHTLTHTQEVKPRNNHTLCRSSIQPRLVMLERPPGGATMRWPDRRGMLSSICAPRKQRLNSYI